MSRFARRGLGAIFLVWCLFPVGSSACAVAVKPPAWGVARIDPALRRALARVMVGQLGVELRLYGYAGLEAGREVQKGHEEYLGCLSCTSNEDNSVFNPQGRFGDLTSRRSIWNRQGPYGDPTSPFSPWNPRAIAPPLLTDEYNRHHGYFTTNLALPERTRLEPVMRLLDTLSVSLP